MFGERAFGVRMQLALDLSNSATIDTAPVDPAADSTPLSNIFRMPSPPSSPPSSPPAIANPHSSEELEVRGHQLEVRMCRSTTQNLL